MRVCALGKCIVLLLCSDKVDMRYWKKRPQINLIVIGLVVTHYWNKCDFYIVFPSLNFVSIGAKAFFVVIRSTFTTMDWTAYAHYMPLAVYVWVKGFHGQQCGKSNNNKHSHHTTIQFDWSKHKSYYTSSAPI